MMINFVKLDPEATKPKRKFETDAGIDLFALRETIIYPREFTFVPVGYKIVMPFLEDLFAWNVCPSSVSRLKLAILPGIIDPGYDGDSGPLMFNLGDRPVVIQKGQKVSQLLVLQKAHAQIEFDDNNKGAVLREAKKWTSPTA